MIIFLIISFFLNMSSSYFGSWFYYFNSSFFPFLCISWSSLLFSFLRYSDMVSQSLVMLSSIHRRIIFFFMRSQSSHPGTSNPLCCLLFPVGLHCWHFSTSVLRRLSWPTSFSTRVLDILQEPISSLFLLSLLPRFCVGLHCHSWSLQCHPSFSNCSMEDVWSFQER